MSYKILISGWYGEKNIGDEIILDSMVMTIRNHDPDAEVTVLSFDPSYTENTSRVKSIHQSPLHMRGIASTILRLRMHRYRDFYKIVRDADLILIGGGGFLSDWNPDAIEPWLRQIWIYKKLFHKKVMIYGVGAGPFVQPGLQTRIKQMFEMVDHITVRDQTSYNEVIQLGVDPKLLTLTADPVVSYPTSKFVVSREEGQTSLLKVGLAIAPLFVNPLWQDHETRYANYQKAWVDFLNGMNERNKDRIEWHFIPMQEDYDIPFNKEIYDRLVYKDNVHLLSSDNNADEKIKILSQMNLIVAVRLHAIIISSLFGIPALGVIYHHKVYEYLKLTGQLDYAVEVGDGGNWRDRSLDAQEMMKHMDKLMIERHKMKEVVKQHLYKLQLKEKENFVIAQALLEGKWI
jgi:polysaccharide pyruvyl transferase WcaK-like protein